MQPWSLSMPGKPHRWPTSLHSPAFLLVGTNQLSFLSAWFSNGTNHISFLPGSQMDCLLGLTPTHFTITHREVWHPTSFTNMASQHPWDWESTHWHSALVDLQSQHQKLPLKATTILCLLSLYGGFFFSIMPHTAYVLFLSILTTTGSYYRKCKWYFG